MNESYTQYHVQLMEGTTYEIFDVTYVLEDWEKKVIHKEKVFQGTIADCAAWLALRQDGHDFAKL